MAFCIRVCVCVPRIGSFAGVGSELPQHGSAIADHERSLVFIDGANHHAIWSDGLCDSDGVTLRAQVIHKLLDTLFWVWETKGIKEKYDKELGREKMYSEVDMQEE